MNDTGKIEDAPQAAELEDLSFTVTGIVSRSPDEVYEAVADPDRLSKYFTTGGARGRLETGATVSWDFHDFPGAFDVRVVEAVPPKRIVIAWAGVETVDVGGTTTTFEFEPVDDGTRTLVTITEAAWRLTEDGAKNAFGNCMGWTGMLAAMKVWVEHGINLREGFYR
ncbi:SRPBCC domain-containing protein [Gordonia neofelifaecis]|uniref:Activator of Hsp90 ATPase 1 family protein n=1 Tax=Gordonia neofelifaecis NRRL B-59395 TaxID=644548 RepID=F1YNJ2_9ACTN|nr:SRPBCC domain-containing protein [Gordonia neofelifaecis]EGD53729.1 Activator of Hsp90 ATPase 1 family protein [Gordonia neofelifaecis NRRL B-59395]